MALLNKETKKKIGHIVKEVNEYAVLADNQNDGVSVEGLDVAPGLGLHTEADNLRSISHDIQKGAFKIIVMGRFKNGKSTFINAMIGKTMMAARATACTAVIATVEFGKDTETVKVYYTDSDEPKLISHDRFLAEFSISQEEQDALYDNEGGRLDRFSNVSHAEMQSMDSLFEDGVKLVDSPGLEEDISRTRVTNEFVPKANAIIFMLNATALFSAKERTYIAENFAGKGMRNVFFVVNRINQLTESLEENVIPVVRKGLEDVFTDKSGIFDEELYKKRVFFLDAYNALCFRTGEPYTVMVGRKQMEIPVDIKDSGMLEFEDALRNFLNSDEKIHAIFSSALSTMANTYQNASGQVSANKDFRSKSKTERERNASNARNELEDARKTVTDMRKTILNSGTIIAKKVYSDLLAFVQTEIPREFEAFQKKSGLVDSLNRDFGTLDFMKLALSMAMSKMPLKAIKNMAPDQEKILRPLVNKVNGYIEEQLQKWQKRIPILVEMDIKELTEELEAQNAEFSLQIDHAVNQLAYGNAKIPVSKGRSGIKEGIQSIIAMSNWDVSLLLESNAEGGMAWGDFLKRVLEQLALDGITFVIFGPGYLVYALIIEVFCAHHRAGKLEEKLKRGIGGSAFEVLANKVRENEVEFVKEIVDSFVKEGENIASPNLNKVEDLEDNIERLLGENNLKQADADEKNLREDKNLKAMHDRIDSVFEAIYGHKPTEAEFVNLARNVKKK